MARVAVGDMVRVGATLWEAAGIASGAWTAEGVCPTGATVCAESTPPQQRTVNRAACLNEGIIGKRASSSQSFI